MTLEIASRTPVLTDEGLPVEELVVNVGPSHPSTHGVGRVIVHLDGDIVVKADMVVGYLHRGIEKMAENRTYLQVVPLTDRLDYVGSMYANWAYCRAVERLAGIRVPERAEYLRVIVCELQRIASHMMGIGASAADTVAFSMFIYAFDVRERIVELFEELCGARLTYNYVRPGGVSMDAPEGWTDDVLRFTAGVRKDLDEMDRLFFGNTIARGRLKGVGVLSADDAVAWGASGPTARGSGVNWDLRKHDPYSVYPRMEFDVIVGDNGDAYDRGRVRLLECFESAKLIEQAVAQMVTGPFKADGLARLIAPAPGDAYDHIESARGSLGIYLVSDGSPRPYRMKVRSPAFCNLALLSKLAVGHTLADLVVVLGSLDPVFGEVDLVTPFLYGMLVGLVSGLVIAIGALIGVWAERKVSARIQMRLGPQEAGPFGLLQTLADTVKLVLKEDITPTQADVPLFRIAPLMVFVPCAAGLSVIPFAAGWAPFNIASGALFFLAVPALSVIGILVAGWSSRNTYASIGGVRGATQMISYELPRTLSVLALCVLAGTISAVGIHDAFRWWWLPVNAIGLLVYFISSIAELNRGPFDLPEAESEAVAGYFADYSGIRWSVFMMAEYGGIVAASLFGTAVFFGGGLGVGGPLGALIYAAIAAFIALAMLWVKWTFPRMRPDQLMNLAWKVLTPMALVQLMIAGILAAVIPWP